MLRCRSRLLLMCALALAAACTPTDVAQLERDAYDSRAEAEQAAYDLAHASPALPPPVLASFAPRVVANGPRNRMRVALTFDACSMKKGTQYDDRITRTLVATETPATIFLGGAWVRQEPETVKELAANPLFELGNHSYTHPHMKRLNDDRRIVDELLKTQREIYDLTGKLPTHFRPPYGEYDGRTSYFAAQAGLTTIEYDLASGDPDRHATKERLIQWVLLKAKPGSIIVMHINHKRFHTAEALPDIIRGLRKKGFELVTVDTLLHDNSPPLCVDPTADDANAIKYAVSRTAAP